MSKIRTTKVVTSVVPKVAPVASKDLLNASIQCKHVRPCCDKHSLCILTLNPQNDP